MKLTALLGNQRDLTSHNRTVNQFPRYLLPGIQSRSESPRYPYPAERETRDSGTKRFRMTRFLSWVQLRRRKRLDKMAMNAEKVFHDGIEFSVAKLGNANLELKQEQYDAIRAICLEKRDLLTVLPTGFGKSLCYQALPGIK